MDGGTYILVEQRIEGTVVFGWYIAMSSSYDCTKIIIFLRLTFRFLEVKDKLRWLLWVGCDIGGWGIVKKFTAVYIFLFEMVISCIHHNCYFVF